MLRVVNILSPPDEQMTHINEPFTFEQVPTAAQLFRLYFDPESNLGSCELCRLRVFLRKLFVVVALAQLHSLPIPQYTSSHRLPRLPKLPCSLHRYRRLKTVLRWPHRYPPILTMSKLSINVRDAELKAKKNLFSPLRRGIRLWKNLTLTRLW
jgi:hypothetical protein